ncbi:hypothetical protein [Photobacterium lipolyticum]|uniref:Uncharacterized protein n=1 Tax=Photobacterium lipolyticum TaxID=266810 RepID=A0A2T3MSP4_9GAMM|nr:hypothetical protein [Photobacterium lipolyticum]PSW01114.1 hypothetical protein C9I89_20150 [Photobacterium lipolyticum]
MDKLFLHHVKSPFAVGDHPKDLFVVSFSDNINTAARELQAKECLLYTRHKNLAQSLIKLTESFEFKADLKTVAFILRSLDSTSYTSYLDQMKKHCNNDTEYYQVLKNLIDDYIQKEYVPDSNGHFTDYTPYHDFHCRSKASFVKRYRSYD